LKFFGILPADKRQMKAKLFRLPDGEEENLSRDFREEIRNFLDREHKPFDPGYKREDDEVFTIRPFSLPEFLTYAAQNWHSCGDIRRGEVKPQSVKAIVGVAYENMRAGSPPTIDVAAFKALDRSKVFDASRRILEWEQDTFVRRPNPSLVVPDGLDAVYERETLFFNTFRTTNGFLDLTAEFKELTNEAVQGVLDDVEWLSYQDDEVPLEKVLNQTNRRLFSLIKATEDFSDLKLDMIKAKACEIDFPLTTGGDGDNKVILLPSTPGEMKNHLEFLLQRFYPGIFDGKLRRANSAEIVGRQ